MKLNYAHTKEFNEISAVILKNLRIISVIITLFWGAVIILIQSNILLHANEPARAMIAVFLFVSLSITGWIHIIEKTQVAGIVNMIVGSLFLFTIVALVGFHIEDYNEIDGILAIIWGGLVYDSARVADIWGVYSVMSKGIVAVALMLGGFKFVSEVILNYGKEELS